VPRKAGKTPYASGIALYLTAADGEPGAQVVAAATTREQASVCFRHAKEMVIASKRLQRHLTPKQFTIEHPASRSTFKVLSHEKKGGHGKNLHGLVVDELHEWTSPGSRDFFIALTTSMGSRSQPLTVIITTAGHGDEMTLCREYHNKAEKVLAGESEDEEFYAAIFAADADGDYADPKQWRKANPSLGVTVSESYLKSEAIKAKEQPSFENEFRRLYLNQWTQTATRWLSLDHWDKCVAPLTYEGLRGGRCVLSLDLSTTYDLTAVNLIYFGDGQPWKVWPNIYCPAATINRRSKDDGVAYQEWQAAGHIIGTTGSKAMTIDYERIQQDILRLANENEIVEVAYDPYNANSIISALEDAGLITVPVYQTARNMSSPSKELERRLVTGDIILPDNPALRQAAANVEVATDRHGNIQPVKPSAKGKYAGTAKYKIDPIISLVIGINRCMLLDTGGATKTRLAQWDGKLTFI
jgi:phage terminase large subunit-like protein